MKRHRVRNMAGMGLIVLLVGLLFGFTCFLSLTEQTDPSVITNRRISEVPVFTNVLLSICTILMVPFGLYLIIDSLTGLARAVRTFIKKNKRPGLKEDVSAFFQQTRAVIEGLQMNKTFIYLHSGGLNHYLDYTDNLVLISRYMRVYENGRPVIYLRLQFIKKEYTLIVDSEACFTRAIEQITNCCPTVSLGEGLQHHGDHSGSSQEGSGNVRDWRLDRW